MNYILSQINRKINFLQSENQTIDLKIYYQTKFEFYLILILGYLWNKNLSKIDIDDKEYILTNILKPSIGTVVSLIRKLDLENEFFGNRKLKKLNLIIDEYPNFRNEKIGHGYSYEDDVEDYNKFFVKFFDIIDEVSEVALLEEFDIIKVTKEEIGHYKGIAYKPDGANYLSWSCPKEIAEFKTGEIYIFVSNQYFKISPFIMIENENEIYTFCAIEEKLTGRTKFNKILKTGHFVTEILDFEKLSISSDSFKRKSANGTVINMFENNFKKFIDIGVAKQVITFLEKNRSSVFATIWGHGGVGKTASIQRVCEILCNQDRKLFDYIIFLSAKDRLYNYYQGKISPIKDGITCLEDLILKVNTILFGGANLETASLKEFQGKLFIIIDDFETFSKDEKEKIISFIKELDIDHHKVVLTTRAATLITGEEIQTKELNEDESITFLLEAMKNEIPEFNTTILQKELKNKETRKKVFEITSGRPLFLLQLGIFAAQKGNLTEALTVEIKSTKEAINFLYDRLYDYLSTDAKNMFLGISLLVNENDLSGLLDNLKFILGKEDKEEEFQNSLSELVKLKIVILSDKDFFRVYSPEIYKLMTVYYQNKGPEYDASITNRFNLILTNRNAPTEKALLENANASRLVDTELEVENKFRYILNREKTPYEIKLSAIFNFANYLLTYRNKPEKALKLYHDYFLVFQKNPNYIRNYSSCAWGVNTTESKYNAVQIIQDFFATKPKLKNDEYLDLLGILLTYRGSIVVTERDDLKQKLRVREIAKNKYELLFNEQKDRFNEIFIYPGKHLYKLVKELDLMSLSPICRNSVLDGLTHFIEVAIRLNKRNIGKEICYKVINEMPHNYHNAFIYKLNKISYIENPEKFENDFNNVIEATSTSDLAIKLKEALIIKQ